MGWFSEMEKELPKHPYIHVYEKGNTKNEQLCLPHKIRNMIHHPENKMNPKYTQEELKKSIITMRNFLLSKKNIQQ